MAASGSDTSLLSGVLLCSEDADLVARMATGLPLSVLCALRAGFLKTASSFDELRSLSEETVAFRARCATFGGSGTGLLIGVAFKAGDCAENEGRGVSTAGSLVFGVSTAGALGFGVSTAGALGFGVLTAGSLGFEVSFVCFSLAGSGVDASSLFLVTDGLVSDRRATGVDCFNKSCRYFILEGVSMAAVLRFAVFGLGGVAATFVFNCVCARVFTEEAFEVSSLELRLVAGLAGVAGVASRDLIEAFLRLPGLAGFGAFFLTGVWAPFGASPLVLSRKDVVVLSRKDVVKSSSLSLSDGLRCFDFDAAASCGVDSISSGFGNWKDCAFFEEVGVGFVFVVFSWLLLDNNRA
jgi:hypothetical protein